MVGQYVFGLRPFLQSQQPVQQYHTISCSDTLLIHKKTKSLKRDDFICMYCRPSAQ